MAQNFDGGRKQLLEEILNGELLKICQYFPRQKFAPYGTVAYFRW